MFNLFTEIKGNARIFEREVSYKKNGKKKTFTAYSVSVSKVDEDGDYINAYMDIHFSKSAEKKIDDMPRGKGDSILVYITDGWLTVKEAGKNEDYNKVALFINDMDEWKEDEPKKKKKKTSDTAKKKTTAKGKKKTKPAEVDEDEEDEDEDEDEDGDGWEEVDEDEDLPF